MEDSTFYSLLKLSNSTEIKKFLHECVDDLIQRRKISFDNYNGGPLEWTKEDFEKAKRNVQTFYKQSVIDGSFQIKSVNLEENIQECLKSCYEIRKKDIFQFLAKSHILKNGNNLIENVDWRLRWVLGTSDLTVLKEPYLQVDLNGIQDNCGKTEKTSVSFEANLEQVDQLIKELTILKKELDE